jgi:DNA-binding XRE family transcriptional regulator
MITAEKLKQLTSLKKDALVGILEKGDSTPSWAYAIKKIKFLGMTNHGQFCYGVEYDGRIVQRNYHARRPDKVFISTTLSGSLVAGT